MGQAQHVLSPCTNMPTRFDTGLAGYKGARSGVKGGLFILPLILYSEYFLMKFQLWVMLAVLLMLGRNSPRVLAVPTTHKAITRGGHTTHGTSNPTATGTNGATHTTGTHGTATGTHTSTAAISSNTSITSASESKPSGKFNRTPIIAGAGKFHQIY